MEGIQYGTQHGYNPMATAAFGTQPYGSQIGQPGQIGQQMFGATANPLSGLFGSGIAGLWSQNVARQPGQVIDGVGGMFQAYANPYGNIDPLTAAAIQQAQLGQQAQLAQQMQLAQIAQQLAQQQLGRVSSFGTDPISAAIAQQRGLFGQQMHLTPFGGLNPLNRIDPVAAAYAQQAQIAQLCQQLALQSQLGQQSQFGHHFGHGQFGQGQVGGWLGGQSLWANPQLATAFGRGIPFQSTPFQYGAGGYGSQLPIY